MLGSLIKLLNGTPSLLFTIVKVGIQCLIWIKVNFIGAKATAKSLRKIAEFFDDQELTENVERVIGEEYPAVSEAQKKYRPRCEGKRAMLFVGGSRAHHYQELFGELGMQTLDQSLISIYVRDAVPEKHFESLVLMGGYGRGEGGYRFIGQLLLNLLRFFKSYYCRISALDCNNIFARGFT